MCFILFILSIFFYFLLLLLFLFMNADCCCVNFTFDFIILLSYISVVIIPPFRHFLIIYIILYTRYFLSLSLSLSLTVSLVHSLTDSLAPSTLLHFLFSSITFPRPSCRLSFRRRNLRIMIAISEILVWVSSGVETCGAKESRVKRMFVSCRQSQIR